MNANFGLMPELRDGARGRQKKTEMGERALAALAAWISRSGIEPPAATAPVPAQA